MWYAVQTLTGKEKLAMRLCTKIIDNGIAEEIFQPRTVREKKIRGEWLKEEIVLFPGYFFIVTNQAEKLFLCLKAVPGFTKLLGMEKDYVIPIHPEEQELIERFSGRKHAPGLSVGSMEGKQIKVTAGPLVEMEGSIVKIDRRKRTAWIQVKLFGGYVTMKVGLELI